MRYVMFKIFSIGIGGAAGAVSRYLLEGLIQSRTTSDFPAGTLAVNLLGCFALGFLMTWADEKFPLNSLVRTGLAVGFLGAFTTFSTFAYETWALARDSQYLIAGANVITSLAGGFLGLLGGVILARSL